MVWFYNINAGKLLKERYEEISLTRKPLPDLSKMLNIILLIMISRNLILPFPSKLNRFRSGSE